MVGFIRYRLDGRLAELRLPPVSWRVAVPVLIVAAAVAVWLLNPESHINEAPAGAQGSPGSGHLLSAGGSNRSQYWQAALNAFASKPVTGIGAGNFALYWNAHPEVALPLLNAHSLYLETLAELGILGLALRARLLRDSGVGRGGEPAMGWAGGRAGARGARGRRGDGGASSGRSRYRPRSCP